MTRPVVPGLLGAIAAGLLFAVNGFAQTVPPETRVAIKGYDPVAYFTENKAVRGTSDLSYDFDDGRYHFSKATNRQAFARSPDRYVPQFAGFCTAGVSKGRRVEANPEYFLIANGKLYTFASQRAKDLVVADPSLLARAEEHWSKGK